MDRSLQTLCEALKKIMGRLKPQQQAVSFVLLIGQSRQGKTTLLRQSPYEHVVVHTDTPADIYYHENSILLELDEAWLNESNSLVQYTLKQLNSCHRGIKISGLVLCVDIHDLFTADPVHAVATSKQHARFLERVGVNLGYRVDTALVLTKLDRLAGFCDFFQHGNTTELTNPLGFSLSDVEKPSQLAETYKQQFDNFIETLGQQVIHKIHPVRSSMKRTLIREFPLQLASLKSALQALIQHIPPNIFRITNLYFTSAEQSGMSTDRLNKKIQHEYALTIQDQYPQSTNHQAYFIEGALRAVHAQTKRYAPSMTLSHTRITHGLMGITGIFILWIATTHLITSKQLDNASKELLTYDALASQQNQDDAALYHLALASKQLENMSSNSLSLPVLTQLKHQVSLQTKQKLQHDFLNEQRHRLEEVISQNQSSPMARYEALKIYLMLAEPSRLIQKEVEAWFIQDWKTSAPDTPVAQSLALLRRALQKPLQPMAINQQMVSDARNVLNALPATYLYYTLAKQAFSQEKEPLHLAGFSLSTNALPVYLTKAGFEQVIARLPEITSELQKNNWVLARQDLSDLHTLLQEAYCYEYVTWW